MEKTNELPRIAVIGDTDTVTGCLLAGTGEVNGNYKNFFIADSKTQNKEIADTFIALTNRDDVAVLLISQHLADRIRPVVDSYERLLPAVLELPSKEAAYDPAKDSVMQRVKVFFGGVLPEV